MSAEVLKEYAALAGYYDVRWEQYTVNSVRNTLARVTVRPTDHVLDMGCGTGALLANVRANRVGGDPSADMLHTARHKLPAVPFFQGWTDALPFADETFDIVFNTSNLHYWDDVPDGLDALYRVLKPGGRLVLTDWCRDYRTMVAMNAYLQTIDNAVKQTYTMAELNGALRKTGFRGVETARYKVTAVWGLMTAVGRKG